MENRHYPLFKKYTQIRSNQIVMCLINKFLIQEYLVCNTLINNKNTLIVSEDFFHFSLEKITQSKDHCYLIYILKILTSHDYTKRK